MNKENMLHLCNGFFLKSFSNKIMKFAGKWMELEKSHPECPRLGKTNVVCIHLHVDISCLSQ